MTGGRELTIGLDSYVHLRLRRVGYGVSAELDIRTAAGLVGGLVPVTWSGGAVYFFIMMNLKAFPKV